MAEAESSGEGLNSFLISQEAADDLWSIWSYVAEEGGVAIANRIESNIRRTPLGLPLENLVLYDLSDCSKLRQ